MPINWRGKHDQRYENGSTHNLEPISFRVNDDILLKPNAGYPS